MLYCVSASVIVITVSASLIVEVTTFLSIVETVVLLSILYVEDTLVPLTVVFNVGVLV